MTLRKLRPPVRLQLIQCCFGRLFGHNAVHRLQIGLEYLRSFGAAYLIELFTPGTCASWQAKDSDLQLNRQR